MEQVTVRCNKCSKLHCFFPQTVRAMGSCTCGNDNWGRPSKWSDGNFGDFTLVVREQVGFVGLVNELLF